MTATARPTFKTTFTRLVTATLTCLATVAGFAAPGNLDSAFAGGTGKLVNHFGGSEGFFSGLAVQPDGMIVTAGYCQGGNAYAFCVARHTRAGVLDASFGSGGLVVAAIGPTLDQAQSVAIQPDGRIVVAGNCNNPNARHFCVARFNADGSFDTGFGNGGKVLTPVGGNTDFGYSVALQTDGKILLAGACYNGSNFDFCAVRYLANGSLDPGFGNGGKVLTPIGSGNDNATAIAIQPDGKLVLAGYCANGAVNDFCLVRYTAAGALDTSFNGTGLVSTPMSSIGLDTRQGLVLQPDGKLVLGGTCVVNGNNKFCLARYLPNGTLDASFGVAGKVLPGASTLFESGYAVALLPDGRIAMAGHCVANSRINFCAARYLTDGTVDASFGSAGKVITVVGSGTSDFAKAAALQSDGKLVVAGDCHDSGSYASCVARYEGGPFAYRNCSPDLDGDGSFLATTDALIYARIALGLTGSAALSGISFPPAATRSTWPLIRDYLVTQCGMSVAP